VIITSQPWREPADLASPHPSEEEVTAFMQGYGFRQVSLTEWRRADGTSAFDVKPGDFVKTREGVVPVDVHLEKTGR
jgi:hypothetical protein